MQLERSRPCLEGNATAGLSMSRSTRAMNRRLAPPPRDQRANRDDQQPRQARQAGIRSECAASATTASQLCSTPADPTATCSTPSPHHELRRAPLTLVSVQWNTGRRPRTSFSTLNRASREVALDSRINSEAPDLVRGPYRPEVRRHVPSPHRVDRVSVDAQAIQATVDRGGNNLFRGTEVQPKCSHSQGLRGTAGIAGQCPKRGRRSDGRLALDPGRCYQQVCKVLATACVQVARWAGGYRVLDYFYYREPTPHIYFPQLLLPELYSQVSFPDIPVRSKGRSGRDLFMGEPGFDAAVTSAGLRELYEMFTGSEFVRWVLSIFEPDLQRLHCRAAAKAIRPTSYLETREALDLAPEVLDESADPNEVFNRFDFAVADPTYTSYVHLDSPRRIVGGLLFFCDAEADRIDGGEFALYRDRLFLGDRVARWPYVAKRFRSRPIRVCCFLTRTADFMVHRGFTLASASGSITQSRVAIVSGMLRIEMRSEQR